MILTSRHEGRTYIYIEKGRSACLKLEDTTLLWWGDPENIPPGAAPLAVLLDLSIQRQSFLT